MRGRRASVVTCTALAALALVFASATTSDASTGLPRPGSAVPHASFTIAQMTDPSPQCLVAESCSDRFGTATSVDAAGDLAVVGAYGWDPDGYLKASSSYGTAWVFEDLSDAWTKVAQLQVQPAEDLAVWQLGMSVSISGDGATILVAGTQLQQVNNAFTCIPGDVAVYTEPPGGWSGSLTPVTYLTPPSPAATSCGLSAALGLSDDGTVAVTSVNGDSAYLEPASGWSSQSAIGPTISLDPPSTVPDSQTIGNEVGLPIAISGDGSTIAATISVSGPTLSGTAIVTYDRPGATWAAAPAALTPDAVIEDPYTANDPIEFGWNAAGTAPVIEGRGTNMGGLSPFSYSAFGPLLGESLALDESGNALVAGNVSECATPPTKPWCDNVTFESAGSYESGPNASYEAGGADVFEQTSNGWVPAANLQSTDTFGGDLAGSSVGISADGTEVIVGAPSRMATGTVGYGSGAAFIYQEGSAGSWSEVNNINPTSLNENGDLGYTVALPGDGSTAFLSDPYFGDRLGTQNEHALRRHPIGHPAALRGEVFSIPDGSSAVISSRSPSKVDPGALVSISGRGFVGSTFTFDGRAVKAVSASATGATIQLPVSAYTGELVAANLDTPIGAGLKLTLQGPIVTRMSTTKAKIGQRVTIYGKYLMTVTKLFPQNDQIKTKITSQTPTSITFLVPRVPKFRRTGKIELVTPVGHVLTAVLTIT